MSAAEVEEINFGIDTARHAHRAAVQSLVNCLGDRSRHFVLQCPDVSQFAIVSVPPKGTRPVVYPDEAR